MYRFKAERAIPGNKVYNLYCGRVWLGSVGMYNYSAKKKWKAYAVISSAASACYFLGVFKTRNEAAKGIFKSAIENKLVKPLDVLSERINNS